MTHHFVTHHLSHTILSHALFRTELSPTPSFTHHLSPHHLSHITLSHTIFHHTIFRTQLCHTPSFTTPAFARNFVTHNLSPHHLSHTTLSHTIFHTQLCQPLSFTHNFVTHTHTIFLCHTPSVTYNFVTHNFVLLVGPPPHPLSFLQVLTVLTIGRSCLVGLSGSLIDFFFLTSIPQTPICFNVQHISLALHSPDIF